MVRYHKADEDATWIYYANVSLIKEDHRLVNRLLFSCVSFFEEF